jgi:HEAT repeat protein
LWAELEDLKRLGPAPATPPETLEQIDAILYSTDPEVKIQAIGKLAESTSAPGVKSAILTALRDPDETVRLAALNVLPKLEDTAVTPLLNGLARDDPSPRVRRRAASLARYTAPQ